jgi:hypothetical protein
MIHAHCRFGPEPVLANDRAFVCVIFCRYAAVYHDNGSGGFEDSENVIEGSWEHFCGENPPQGAENASFYAISY